MKQKNNPRRSMTKPMDQGKPDQYPPPAVESIRQFLSNVIPFSFLPEDALKNAAAHMPRIFLPAEKVLFYQSVSRVESLYIVETGAAERYFEERGEKRLRGVLGEGDVYGGISILINNGISVRTVRMKEDTRLYHLPRGYFLDLCSKYADFSAYFTDTFGKLMIDSAYAAIIRKAASVPEEASRFFHLRVADVYHPDILSCPDSTAIQDAARQMNRQNCSAIFVTSETGDYIGVLTDNDLRRKVIATGADIRGPVADIMSSPLLTISDDAMVSEALLEMMESNVKHLGVTRHRGGMAGVLTNSDLLAAQEQSPYFLIREISGAESVDDLGEAWKRLPRLAQNLINSGAKSRIVTRLISSISDAILSRLIEFALDMLGPPPVEFAFIVMGSEGRLEQTLKTDQDNAIIYRDPEPEMAREAETYFLKLGNTVCNWLNRVGYAFCQGDIMAKNVTWCRPFSQWKSYFHSWIRVTTGRDLLRSTIFFDFRLGYGDAALVDHLKLFLFETLQGWSRFFHDLTVNALRFRPPIGFFRNFVVESKGEHRNKFDIKKAMTPIVDAARIYALHENIADTNTQDRIYRLYLKKKFDSAAFNELNQVYNYLMQQRLLVQVETIGAGGRPDNFINPRKMSRIEQTLLKEIFKRIEGLQTKLSLDFTGNA